MSNITLTASMRSNLSSLKILSKQMGKTQERLATGKKVNSAIDNASSYYQARALTNRAADLNALLDSMGQGIQTIQAATTGLEKAVDFMEQASAIAMQAASQATLAYNETLTFHDLWDGRSATQAIINELGDNGGTPYAAQLAANYFAVSEDDETFGKGNWYLPSMGELVEAYGIKYSDVTETGGASGATGENYEKISVSLEAIGSDKASDLKNSYYSTSTEHSVPYSYYFNLTTGNRTNGGKSFANYYVRPFQLLENAFDPSDGIAIGDIVYSDLSHSSAADYDSSKEAVGVVAWVSESGASVKIMALKDASASKVQWGGMGTDIPELTNYIFADILNIFQSVANGTVDSYNVETNVDLSDYENQFNRILEQYDDLISDSGYQGINLLSGGTLSVTLNESRTHSYTVKGFDATAAALGVKAAEWKSLQDINKTVSQILSAVNTMRDYQSQLGTAYGIIQNRETFTDAMTDVLEIGADELVLADMNEESANYLALQTRQQLAINSLSLAAQSAQSILKLF